MIGKIINLLVGITLLVSVIGIAWSGMRQVPAITVYIIVEITANILGGISTVKFNLYYFTPFGVAEGTAKPNPLLKFSGGLAMWVSTLIILFALISVFLFDWGTWTFPVGIFFIGLCSYFIGKLLGMGVNLFRDRCGGDDRVREMLRVPNHNNSEDDRPNCSDCGSSNTYYRKTLDSWRCRRCGIEF